MKNLDGYRKEILKRIYLTILLCSVALIVLLICNFYLKYKFPTNDMASGYTMGFFIGIEIMCVYYMGKFIRAYYNPKILQNMYLRETDEREILIKMKSGKNIVPILSIIIVIVSFVVVYFNYAAFVTLQSVAFIQLVICCLLRMYWKYKI